jgi:hypothetical protein
MIPSADTVDNVEGDAAGCDSASIRLARRGGIRREIILHQVGLLIANDASREAAATRRLLSKAVVWFM